MSLTADLEQAQVIFIDTPVVIYEIEAHATFGPLAREAVHAFRVGTVQACTSVMTIVEVLPKPVAAGDEALAGEFLHVLHHTRNLALLDVSDEVAERAGRLRGRYPGLKSADAVQLATAILADAKAFVTNDAGLKRIRELRIILLSDYLPSPVPPKP